MTTKHTGLLLACIAFVLNAVVVSETRAADSPTGKKSISQWVSCKETQDDSLGAIKAFAAARHNAFTLVVDCPVFIHSGLDIARAIYIDDGTSVEFTPAGKFIVDNVMHPAFVLGNSSAVTLTNWNVEYNATLPTNPDVGGYAQNGRFTSVAGHNQPSGPWNDLEFTAWLAANRGIKFDHSAGNVRASWSGLTNVCAVFFVTGDTSNVTFNGLNVHVPANAGAERFVPVVFQFSGNIRSNKTITATSSRSAEYVAVPHDMTFTNVTFDGTIMGWVGNVQNATFEHIRSHRYADLQDASGGTNGGLGKWFAPPHLFYLGYSSDEDPGLFNRNIKIHDVVDDGPRVGAARDKGGSDTLSGNALSLKIGCYECSVDNYTSTRPDGFLDVLPSHGLKISNVKATYDSSFLNNLFPGWRFPSKEYSDLTFENITLQDTAPSTVQMPVGQSTVPANQNITIKNVHVIINRWAGSQELPLPNIMGNGIDVSIDYDILGDSSRIASVHKGSVNIALKATPAKLSAGRATTVTWATQADACSAGGAWNGSNLSSKGSRSVTLEKPGESDLTLSCRSSSDTAEARLPVVVN
jgi:hypothetical protein